MANVRLATATNNAACDAVVDLIDGGVAAGTIQIRSGTQPATANLAATGTLLATLTWSDPAFGAASSGVATANSITSDTSADATGTATWARLLDSDSNTIFDCDVGEAADSATITLNSKSISAGVEVQITAFTVTHPDGT